MVELALAFAFTAPAVTPVAIATPVAVRVPVTRRPARIIILPPNPVAPTVAQSFFPAVRVTVAPQTIKSANC